MFVAIRRRPCASVVARVKRWLPQHLALLFLLFLLAGCASGPPILPEHLPAQAQPVELRATPFHAQQRYQCGPAALAMILQTTDVDVTPADLVSRVYLPKRKGSIQTEMVAAAREYGRLPYLLPPDLDALLTELRGGHPVLVFENLGWELYPAWHYAVVIGYDPKADQIILRSGTTRRKTVATRAFMTKWDKADNWALVLLRPGDLPATDAPKRYLKAAVGFEEKASPADAQAVYAAAIRRWPQEAPAWLGLGNTLYAQNDLTGAEAAYRSLLHQRPTSAIARNNLAQVLADRGCRSAAQRQIKRAREHAPDELRQTLEATRRAIDAAPVIESASCSGPLRHSKNQ